MLTSEQIANFRTRFKDTTTGEKGLSDLWSDLCPVLDEILLCAEAYADMCWLVSHPVGKEYVHESEGIYSFPRVVLAPDAWCLVPLELSLPFQLTSLIANPDNTSGLVVEKVLVGDKNLIASVGKVPIQRFYDGISPVRFDEVRAPIGVPLRLCVRNNAGVTRILGIAARGIVFSNTSREER